MDAWGSVGLVVRLTIITLILMLKLILILISATLRLLYMCMTYCTLANTNIDPYLVTHLVQLSCIERFCSLPADIVSCPDHSFASAHSLKALMNQSKHRTLSLQVMDPDHIVAQPWQSLRSSASGWCHLAKPSANCSRRLPPCQRHPRELVLFSPSTAGSQK